jgi:hypothetical protein
MAFLAMRLTSWGRAFDGGEDDETGVVESFECRLTQGAVYPSTNNLSLHNSLEVFKLTLSCILTRPLLAEVVRGEVISVPPYSSALIPLSMRFLVRSDNSLYPIRVIQRRSCWEMVPRCLVSTPKLHGGTTGKATALVSVALRLRDITTATRTPLTDGSGGKDRSSSMTGGCDHNGCDGVWLIDVP